MSEMLNISDSARVVGISRKTLYEHIKSGKVSVTRQGNKRYISVSELLRAYGSIKRELLPEGDARLQSDLKRKGNSKETDLILTRLERLVKDNEDLRTEVNALKELTQLQIEYNDKQKSLSDENQSLKSELDRIKKRGVFGRLLNR